MEIRNAAAKDIPALAQNRLEFVRLIREIADEDAFYRATEDYLRAHIDDGSLIALCAFDGERIVSSAILCIYEILPVARNLRSINGLLLNVYTLADYRRQGLAFRLLTELFAQAKAAGVCEIYLDYTDAGYPLYQKLGFEELAHEMMLKI